MSLFRQTIELYEFLRGGEGWRYTSADRALQVDGAVHEPIAGLKRGRIVQSPEQGKAKLDITAPLSMPVLALWRPMPPMERITFRLRILDKGSGEVRIGWMGIVADVDEGQHTAKISCVSNVVSMAANGLNRVWQIACGAAVYSQGRGQCNLQANDWAIETRLSHMQGVTVQSLAFASKPDGYFNGGFIQWRIGAGIERRFVIAHRGDTLTLMTPVPARAPQAVTVWPGCDHTLQTCHDKFNNALNYTGQHTIPPKNPWGSDSIF